MVPASVSTGITKIEIIQNMINTKNILKYLIWGGLFLTPIIAFIVPSNMYFPYIAGKGFAFRVLVEILFGLLVALAFVDKDYRPQFSWLMGSALLFAIVIFIADLFGKNPYKSIWSNYERMEGFILTLHLVMYYIVVSSVLKTQDIWDKFFTISISASVVMSFYGLFQLVRAGGVWVNGGRVDGTFGNSAYMAMYLIFNIFLCIYLVALGGKENWQKWIYGLIILLELVLLYFTATRGAIVGLLGGLTIMGILLAWKEREKKHIRRISYWLIGAIVVSIIGFISVRGTSSVKNNPVLGRFASLSVAELHTQEERYFIWPIALEGIKERPLLGWGQENFNLVFHKYYNPAMYGQDEWVDRAHDLILEWLIAGGIIGFLTYVSIYVALFYLIWRKGSTLKLLQKSVLTGMISAYVFHNIFTFDNLMSYMIFFSILAYVHSVNVSEKKETSKFYCKAFDGEVLNCIVYPLVVISTFAMIYFVNIPALLTNITLRQAISQKRNVETNLKLFKKAFDYNSFGSSEVLEQLLPYSTQSQVLKEKQKDFYDFSKLQIEQNIASTDARYLVLSGGFFSRFRQYDDAVKYLERALIESPNKQSIHFELGFAYLGKGDTQRMFDLFERAYDLKPSSAESQILYTVGAIYANKADVVKEMFTIVPKDTYITDARIMGACSRAGDYTTAVTILKARLEKDPTNLQNKFDLAKAYLMLKQKHTSISLIREMIAQDPQFKDQGETYIKQIEGM